MGELSHLPFAKTPLEYLSIDTVGGLGGYKSQKCYLHLAIDHLTRFVWALPSKTQTAIDFINLIDRVKQCKSPENILADKYAGIKSRGFMSYCRKSNINLIFTATDCPQSNGLVERVGQTIISGLKAKIFENPRISWVKLIKDVVETYNKRPHTTTKFSPDFLLFGLQCDDELINPDKLNIKEAREIARENTMQSFSKYKARYDRHHKVHTFSIGDWVWKENRNKIQKKKLDAFRIGPFQISRKISDTMYEIQINPSKTEVVRIDKLLPYNEF